MSSLLVWVAAATSLALVCSGSSAVLAQQPPTVRGDFVGTLGALPLRLHIVAAPNGTLSGTLDSPSQGAAGLPCTDIVADRHTLSFNVPSVGGRWTGSIQDGGATLSGTWTQGQSLPLTFTRDTFIPAATPSPVDGFWLGTLQTPTQTLRIQIAVRSDSARTEFCALDSPDQNAFNFPCANVVYADGDFSFDVPAVNGRWRGRLSADRQSLQGTWTQRGAFPLNFARGETPERPPGRPPIAFDPAIAPVDAAGMQAVLGRDLDKALKGGALAPATSAGVTIGVVQNGVRRVFSFGTATPDSIFEIGSITKTFTGLVLAQMIAQGTVKLNEPVRELLPQGTVAKPPGSEITLLDLVTHHSGLPLLPDNWRPANQNNPYADYRPANLHEFLGTRGVERPAEAAFLYSNLGVGLLGQALANRANMTYARLVEQKVTLPLGMKDTGMSLSPEQQRRFIQGHATDHKPAHAWDFDALAGAGALRSTAGDMLTYLEANLHPETFGSRSNAEADVRTLAQALEQSHDLRADVAPGQRIAFAWLYDMTTDDYWHSGGTGGFRSFAFFNPKGNYAAIVLFNTSSGGRASFADQVGRHIGQRFAGKPAISLGQ